MADKAGSSRTSRKVAAKKKESTKKASASAASKQAPTKKAPKKTQSKREANKKAKADAERKARAEKAKRLEKMLSDLPEHGPGRPRVFETSIEFEHACAQYFKDRLGVKVKEREWQHGQYVEHEVTKDLPVTIEDLCDVLGIARKTFYNYAQPGHDFYEVAEWSKNKIEVSTQKRLYDRETFPGAKFMLQAKHDYHEKKDVNISGGISNSEFLAALDEPDENE